MKRMALLLFPSSIGVQPTISVISVILPVGSPTPGSVAQSIQSIQSIPMIVSARMCQQTQIHRFVT